MAKKTPVEGKLWKQWLRLQPRLRNKVVVIDAAHGAQWTAANVTQSALDFSPRLQPYRNGERIAFRIPNGVGWFALFLALQRGNLAAIPLDGAMPVEGCFETARRLGASALYLDGEFHALEAGRARRRACSCIKVTSGSSSLPKAVECTAEHLLADGRHVVATMKIHPGDLNLGVIPLGHSYGLGNLVMPLILQGTGVVCAGEYLPRQLIDWIKQYRVTVFPCVPALLRILAALPTGEGKLESLRTVISAGAVLTPMVAQSFFDRFGLKVHNFYGSSETGGICYDRTGNASLTGRSVGKPLDGVSVTVKARRITVRSPAVATRAGQWRLGDFGEWNSRGELVLLGRAGLGANIGGKKVHPLEVERALRSQAAVSDAAVWLEHRNGRDLLIAGVETAGARADIEKALATKLPAWKMPKDYFIARELPRTPRGKIDLGAIRKKLNLG